MIQTDPPTVETWELRWSLRNHRAFARSFLFALSAAVVLLLAGLAVAPSVLAQSTASDLVNSGIAKGRKGDLDGASADFSRAIELDPKYAMAYNNRGIAKEKKGDLDGAIADYSRAIELNPKYASAYNNRGNVFQAKGQFDQAVADFSDTIKLNTKDEYACLRLLIATWLAKGDTGGGTATLRKHIDANSSDEWVHTISKYYVGIDNLNEQAVLAEARKGKDGKEVEERLCEAYYYLGVKRLVVGNRKGAAEYFTLSIGTDVKSFTEHHMSKAMFALMKEGKI
jgi:lipoprotein NlpI